MSHLDLVIEFAPSFDTTIFNLSVKIMANYLDD